MPNIDTDQEHDGSILRTQLLSAVLNEPRTVQCVEAKRVELPPNQRSGLHLLPCPVVGVIVKGSVVVHIQGQRATVLKPGDAFYEPAHTNIRRFDSLEDGATFVACYLLAEGEDKLIGMLSP